MKTSQQILFFHMLVLVVILFSIKNNLTITKMKDLQSSEQTLYKSRSLQPKIGTSAYVVNNSLLCSLQPKRVSFDIKLYLQLHRKLVRKAIIEKKFQESMVDANQFTGNQRKGFKGKMKPDTFVVQNNNPKERERRTQTQASERPYQSTYRWSNSRNGNISPYEQQKRQRAQTATSSHLKPNMMYNLSLYRKGFKHSNFKRQKMCQTIMENLQRTRRELTRDRHSKYNVATLL